MYMNISKHAIAACLTAVLLAADTALTAADTAFFTVGSTSGQVEKIQGKPDRIDRYPALGYDIWRYGDSQVKIAVKTGQVLDWVDFSRNLKATAPETLQPASVNEPVGQNNQSVNVNFDSSFNASVNQQRVPGQPLYQTPSVISLSGTGFGFDGGGRGRTRSVVDPRQDGEGFHIPGVPNHIPGVPGFVDDGYNSFGVNINCNTGPTKLNEPGQQMGIDSGGVSIGNASSLNSKDFFDVGSSKDDVLRLQGKPDRIDRYPALGYDIWRYGISQVKVSVTTGNVLECVDFGRNLKTPP